MRKSSAQASWQVCSYLFYSGAWEQATTSRFMAAPNGSGRFLALVAGISLFVTAGETNETTSQRRGKKCPFMGKTILLGIALIGSLLLLSFAFTAPYVTARWTGENHERIFIFQALVFALFALIAGLRPQWIKNIKQWGLLLWNALFTVALTATMLLNQETFSKNENAYPFTARPQSSFQAIALYATILLAPVLFANVMRMVKTTQHKAPDAPCAHGRCFIGLPLLSHHGAGTCLHLCLRLHAACGPLLSR